MKLFKMLENSWVFWTIFIAAAIEGFGYLVAGPAGLAYSPFMFPAGLLAFVPFTQAIFDSLGGWFFYPFIILFYGALTFAVRKMVIDKSFNTRWVLFVIGMLLLTMVGCTIQMSGF